MAEVAIKNQNHNSGNKIDRGSNLIQNARNSNQYPPLRPLTTSYGISVTVSKVAPMYLLN